jgi:hypothetical protein
MYLNENKNKVGIVKHLSDTVPVQNVTPSPTKRDSLSPLNFNSAFAYGMSLRKSKKSSWD